MARRRDSSSEAFVVLFALVALAAVLSFGAALLYFPLRKYPHNNPGKGLGVFGIVIIFVGLGVLVYQASSAAGIDSEQSSNVTWAAWIPACVGLVVYLLALAWAGNYQSDVLAATDEIEALVLNKSVSESQLLDAAQQICRKRLLLKSDIHGALSRASRNRSVQMIENGGELPTTSPPEGVFLGPGERCHAGFSRVEYYEDVFGTERSTAGGALYWKVADGITLRPTAYSGRSMPVSELRRMDLGSLVISDRRVIFQGNRYVKEIALDGILGLSPYENGFQIQTSGKSKREVFSMPALDVRLATILISRLVARA